MWKMRKRENVKNMGWLQMAGYMLQGILNYRLQTNC